MSVAKVRIIAAVLACALVLAGVIGYRASVARQQKDDLSAAAAALAEGLRTGKLPPGHVEGAPDVAALLEETTASTHDVDVTDVQVDGERGRVTLRHRWTPRPGGDPYTYPVEAEFSRADGRWITRWSPPLLAPGLKDDERLRVTRRSGARGDILDHTGAPLVTLRKVVRIGIDRSAVTKEIAVASAGVLARALDLGVAYPESVGSAGEKAFVPALTVRDPSPELTAVSQLSVPGLLMQEDELPLPPTSSFAKALLGGVGEATAEIVERSQGKISPGEMVGIGGLQAAQEQVLAGTPRTTWQAVSARGESRVLHVTKERPGRAVGTTLDQNVQTAAEDALSTVSTTSALVAIRPSDGAVLAAASGPGGKGDPTATLSMYPPGSTFKAVTALAALRSGLSPSSSVSCPATLVVDGRTFKNYDGYPNSKLGTQTLRSVFAQSCNTAFIGLRDRIGEKALTEAAASLGLTGEPTLGVPAETGKVPAPSGETERAASLIGQGRVESTPLGMAAVAASIADGRTVSPMLVRDPAPQQKPSSGTPLSPEEATSLRDLMRAVVTEGNAPLLADAPGGAVAAKSGTAEYGTGTPPRTHAWMIAAQGDLALAIFVADAGGGASDAGPVVKKFLTALASSR
ncbi:Cell division protein FtsI/penicillin-binding protein 2 [Austwickia chelonae]|uniref:Putative penicillin-binding protein n=1 Tax=Austwickia chelonae NBRC 105200 TaxID=1184607 RepID=K6VL27_9MICO|nr:penicillin-binding transpeptidase domain-containing protein [Austwickia chelonae]GAB77439.1 putative penicillin-binding protein [Austwickia chelonae NBRC 105200]SEW10456.1 Cell division protein FtsI/penicillin-binding protein 2 [Austwickia chelonae]